MTGSFFGRDGDSGHDRDIGLGHLTFDHRYRIGPDRFFISLTSASTNFTDSFNYALAIYLKNGSFSASEAIFSILCYK
jgi:hypothetical protein